MVYNINYRRPAYVTNDRRNSDRASSTHGSVNSEGSAFSYGIPDALSFDKIIQGGTCPPCTLRDFMNYLRFIEHDAENLQFFLWFKDYATRFNALKESEKVLAPEWEKDSSDFESTPSPTRSPRGMSDETRKHINEILKDTDFDEKNNTYFGNFEEGNNTAPSISDIASSNGNGTMHTRETHHSNAGKAFEDAGMKWKPFTSQPYREEVDRIISIYFAEGAPRELNISHRERTAALHALQNTTHPSAVKPIAASIEYALRRQSHPNFIRWTICNGNRPRVVFARGLGIFGMSAGLLAHLLITLSSAHRAWRVLPFLGWFIGIATLIAAIKGMCVVLHGLHHRHLRPWELFADDTEEVIDEKNVSQVSLLSASTNSYEEEPWVARYQKRNIIRKIFDREIWVQEPALRQIQDTIFLQANLGAFILSAIITAIFLAVPAGNFY